MASNPIPKCVICGKPIVRMVRQWCVDDYGRKSYYLRWSKSKYCSNRCQKRAYRKRRKLKQLHRIFGDS